MSGSVHSTGLPDGEAPSCSRGQEAGEEGMEERSGAHRLPGPKTIGRRAAPKAVCGRSSCSISAAMGRIRLVALLVLLWGSQPGDGQPVLSGPAGGVFYSGKNVLYPLPIDFSINAGVLVKPWTIEVELKNARCGLPCVRVGLMLQELGCVSNSIS